MPSQAPPESSKTREDARSTASMSVDTGNGSPARSSRLKRLSSLCGRKVDMLSLTCSRRPSMRG